MDLADAMAQAQRLTPSQRLLQSLELSNLARALAAACGTKWVVGKGDLAEKARLWGGAVRAIARHASKP